MSSADREVTPRLQQYLKNKSLVQYSNNLIQLGFMSVDTIAGIPTEEDTYFVNKLNINGYVDTIAIKSMINEIRSDIQNNTKIIPTSNNNIDLITNQSTQNTNNNDVENEYIINDNTNDISNDNTNEIGVYGSNEKYFMELTESYGTKAEYKIGEKIIFFIPSMANRLIYIDRIGIIKSQICNTE
eukprot:256365_1